MRALPIVFATSALLVSACGSSSSSPSPAGPGQGGTDAAGSAGSGATGGAFTGMGGTTSAGGTGAGKGGAGVGGGAAGGTGGGAGGAATCAVGDPPAGVPTLMGKFVQSDGTPANSAPTMTGGDVTGTWIFDSLVIYLPLGAKNLVDPSMSSVTGTAWSVLGTDGSYKLSTHIESMLATVAGPMSSTTDSQSLGTYVTMGSSLTPMTTCSTSNNNSTLEYTRTGATGQFVVHTMSNGNQIDLLLSGKVQ